MNSVQSLSHTKWECKYHVTWIPKYRKKQIYKELRKHLGEVLRDLARRKECKIVEGHLMADHAHMLISIPPKYAVSQIIGFIKSKSAVHIAREHFLQKKKLYGTTLLGQRISCFDRRKRRRSDSELYQVTRKREPKDRTAEFVQVDGQR